MGEREKGRGDGGRGSSKHPLNIKHGPDLRAVLPNLPRSMTCVVFILKMRQPSFKTLP